jgi:hypothetical protein
LHNHQATVADLARVTLRQPTTSANCAGPLCARGFCPVELGPFAFLDLLVASFGVGVRSEKEAFGGPVRPTWDCRVLTLPSLGISSTAMMPRCGGLRMPPGSPKVRSCSQRFRQTQIPQGHIVLCSRLRRGKLVRRCSFVAHWPRPARCASQGGVVGPCCGSCSNEYLKLIIGSNTH